MLCWHSSIHAAFIFAVWFWEGDLGLKLADSGLELGISLTLAWERRRLGRPRWMTLHCLLAPLLQERRPGVGCVLGVPLLPDPRRDEGWQM